MSRRPPGIEWCRSEGCKTEATFKTIDTHDPLDRRTPAGIRASVGGQPGRGSPNGYRLVSLYCKQRMRSSEASSSLSGVTDPSARHLHSLLPGGRMCQQETTARCRVCHP